MVEFFKTVMGRKLIEADFPRLVHALERIASSMEKKALPPRGRGGLDDPLAKLIHGVLLENIARSCDNGRDRMELAEALTTALRREYGG
jgi:hypothetical protein